MRFIVIVYPGSVKEYEAGHMPEPGLLDAMGRFNEQLVEAGVMRAGDGLKPSAHGMRLHFPGGGQSPQLSKGPFSTEYLMGGFWIWEVKSPEEALMWAKRAPMEDGATLELRPLFEPEDFGPEIEAQEKALIEKMEKQRG